MYAEKKALCIARKYGMAAEYLETRSMGYSMEDALEEWDLYDIGKATPPIKRDGHQADK